MIEFVRSRQAMFLATIAAVVFALGSALLGITYATLNVSVYNFLNAALWLQFVGGFMAFAATTFVAWKLITGQSQAMWEATGAAFTTLVFAFGLLVSTPQLLSLFSPWETVTKVVGVGGWAALILVSAARNASLEKSSPRSTRQAGLRLAAGCCVLLIAIFNLVSASTYQATRAVVITSLDAIGVFGLVIVLTIARTRRLILTKRFSLLAAGLWLLVFGAVVRAVTTGIISGPRPPSILSVRVGFSIPEFIFALAFFVLAFAAFGRVGELSSIS